MKLIQNRHHKMEIRQWNDYTLDVESNLGIDSVQLMQNGIKIKYDWNGSQTGV